MEPQAKGAECPAKLNPFTGLRFARALVLSPNAAERHRPQNGSRRRIAVDYI